VSKVAKANLVFKSESLCKSIISSWKSTDRSEGFTMNGEQKTWKSVKRFPKIWNRCLNSRNNFVILSLYWFKTLFSPVARTLFRQRKWAVPSPESCVSHKDNYGAPFVKILYLTDLAQKALSLRIYSYLCMQRCYL